MDVLVVSARDRVAASTTFRASCAVMVDVVSGGWCLLSGVLLIRLRLRQGGRLYSLSARVVVGLASAEGWWVADNATSIAIPPLHPVRPELPPDELCGPNRAAYPMPFPSRPIE